MKDVEDRSTSAGNIPLVLVAQFCAFQIYKRVQLTGRLPRRLCSASSLRQQRHTILSTNVNNIVLLRSASALAISQMSLAFSQTVFRLPFRHDSPRFSSSLRQRPRFTCSALSHESHPLSYALKAAPSEPGVYRFLDDTKNPLYIGKARRIRARLRQYLTSNPESPVGVSPLPTVSLRIRTMLEAASSVDFIVTKTEAAALALEASLVQESQPLYNVLLKDDRRHPYALITFSEPYPRITLTRSRRKSHKNDKLYGPFVNENVLRKLLTAVHATFPLRQRQKVLFSDRPCINYDLGRCPGVCQQLISSDEYKQTVDKVDKLFSGRTEEVVQALREEMLHQSSMMNYEQAALIRDRIASLQNAFGDTIDLHDTFDGVQEASAVVSPHSFDSRDIFAISRNENVCKVVVFQVRGGKLVSRLVFSVHPNAEDSELLGAVLTAHYARLNHPLEIPEELVLCTPTDDASLIATALSEKRGKKVNVRGKKNVPLADIAQRNADMEVNIEVERVHNATNDTHVLLDMLRPYFKSFEEPNALLKLETGNSLKISALKRIECFDISHTSGSNAVGSMAVFINGSPVTSEYRRFNLEEEYSHRGHPDDFASIQETIRKRFRQWSRRGVSDGVSVPDLIVVDGGKGQLSSAAEALRKIGLHGRIPLISIAKGEEAIYVEGERNAINYDVGSDTHLMNEGVRLICRLRDEAHRTALAAHRRRRGRETLKSGLDSVSGLGPSRRTALLDHFNSSVEAIANASPEQLCQVSGIGPALANRLHRHFNAG